MMIKQTEIKEVIIDINSSLREFHACLVDDRHH